MDPIYVVFGIVMGMGLMMFVTIYAAERCNT